MPWSSLPSLCSRPIGIGLLAIASVLGPARAENPGSSPTAGHERLAPADGGSASLYTLWIKRDTNDLLAELPAGFADQTLLLGTCRSGGSVAPWIQGDTMLARWRRIGDRLAFVVLQTDYRTSDPAARRAHETLFTDRVYFDVPILGVGESGGPIIDLDEIFVDRCEELFFQFIPGDLDPSLGVISKAKAFAGNITLGFEMPYRSRGQIDDGMLVSMAFSLSVVPETDYTPRMADPRVGYFITGYTDLAYAPDGESRRRPIKRWDLRPADPTLALGPPRRPIVFYIDHHTPIRWRHWVREGILAWNKAFEQVGIVNAIEVYQQDADTGANMDKDPENVEHNFVVWNPNDISFAIGPSRADPRTGQILDADVVMNDGWLRVAVRDWESYFGGAIGEGFDQQSRAWLASHPSWDPFGIAAGPASTQQAPPGHARISIGARDLDGPDHTSACAYGDCRAMDASLARLGLLDLGPEADPLLGNAPEEFIGQQIRDVIMHEIGHVLGLRHNFAASGVYSIQEINSARWRDERLPIAGSVMDYNPINICTIAGGVQGPYFMEDLGPYDMWAIACGYAPEARLPEILARAGEPEHVYLTDEDLYGPDPMARTRDLGSSVLDFAESELAHTHRLIAQIPTRALREGRSYQRARDAYMTLLALRSRDLSAAMRQIGGVRVFRNPFAPGSRLPTALVAPADQRRALRLLVDNLFRDEAFGLTPDLLAHMSMDKWFDGATIPQDVPDAALDVHDTVLNVQSSFLTALLNPTRLRRILDNEQRLPSEDDAFTLVELLSGVQDAAWAEVMEPGRDAAGPYSARSPLISSLRRNLQREHLERMIALSMPGGLTGAAAKPVATLATSLLRRLQGRIDEVLARRGSVLDEYTRAHLEDASTRIGRALDAVYIYRQP